MAKGQWKKNYESSFITEMDGSGCLGECPAKVVSPGGEGLVGSGEDIVWSDWLDESGGSVRLHGCVRGDEKCDNLDSPLSSADETPTNIDDARTQVEANLRTPDGKAYDAKLRAEFTQKYSGTARLCKKSAVDDTENFWMLLKLGANGNVKEVLLNPTTKLGACARETLLLDSFWPPPRPAYWVSVYMKIPN